jgi:hypothetical protein
MVQQQRGIYVYRFDYEKPHSSTGESRQWHCNIAAYNQEEAFDYLMRLFPAARVSQISQECALHAISDPLRKIISETAKRKPGRPKGTTKGKK